MNYYFHPDAETEHFDAIKFFEQRQISLGLMYLTEVFMSIGEIVKERRKAKKLNQTELAEKAGITQATVSRLESGKEDNTTIENLRSIAAALSCSVVDLLPDTDRKRPSKKPVVL
jgi:DNA-binding Xre family transcriptional regulator